jgi:hypothetical protein
VLAIVDQLWTRKREQSQLAHCLLLCSGILLANGISRTQIRVRWAERSIAEAGTWISEFIVASAPVILSLTTGAGVKHFCEHFCGDANGRAISLSGEGFDVADQGRVLVIVR